MYLLRKHTGEIFFNYFVWLILYLYSWSCRSNDSILEFQGIKYGRYFIQGFGVIRFGPHVHRYQSTMDHCSHDQMRPTGEESLVLALCKVNIFVDTERHNNKWNLYLYYVWWKVFLHLSMDWWSLHLWNLFMNFCTL